MTTSRLPVPSMGHSRGHSQPVRWGDYLITMLDMGLACCGVEVMAALHGRPEGGLPRQAPAEQGREIRVLVVSGTVTDVMLPAVLAAYRELPDPKYVLSVGACCNTGGPYWDSYAVTKGIDQLLPVHVAVPGCPPRPEALLDGLAALHRMLGGQP